jgi:AcrR family transcriptional regulator
MSASEPASKSEPESEPDTRSRILAIAGRMFAERGYAATSLSDIATELGTSKAALYYHFRSKASIFGALVAEPIEAMRRLSESASDRAMTAFDILGAVIDTTIASRALVGVIESDPSTRALVNAEETRATSDAINAAIVAALAARTTEPGASIRAQIAYTVARLGAVSVLPFAGADAREQSRQFADDRAELLAAALRVLN